MRYLNNDLISTAGATSNDGNYGALTSSAVVQGSTGTDFFRKVYGDEAWQKLKSSVNHMGYVGSAEQWNRKDNMSTVNKAGNYTKPTMRKKIFQRIKAQASHGTKAGQWSARKAQALAKAYKKAGGGYK